MKSKQQPSSNTIRCKYCYRKGHSDNNCQDKANKRPPSMPEWISKATCAKCKKKGHLAFNCPPKYGNKIVKSSKFSKKKGPNKIESADHVTEFAGMVYHTDREKKNLSFDMNYIFDKRKDELNRQLSFATRFGTATTNRLVWVIFLLAVGFSMVNIFFINEYTIPGIIILSMTFLLVVIQYFPSYF